MMNRAVFLDRDGTINREVHHLHRPEQVELIEGAAEAIRSFNRHGFKVIVVTNQSAIARGYLTENELEKIHSFLGVLLEAYNAHIDAFYYCPHHPSEGVAPYRVDCNCRKPKSGMLDRAVKEHQLDVKASFLIGDKLSDLKAGQAVGCRNILVLTGYGKETEKGLQNDSFLADHIADNLLNASKWILEQVTYSGRESRCCQ